MRILNFGRTMGTGGAEKVMLQLVSLQRQQHMESWVCTSGGKHVEELKTMGIDHVTIPDIDDKNPVRMIKILIILYKTININHIQVVHTHHRMAAFYIRLLNFLHVIHVRQINTQHNVFKDKKFLTHFALGDSENIAVGNGVKQNLIDDFKIDPKKVRVIYNSVKPPIQDKHDNIIHDKKMTVVSIGRLSRQKGMTYFIQAAEIIKKITHDQIIFRIVGDGELESTLKAEIEQRDVQDICKLVGYTADTFSEIQAANLVVQSSLWEGLPLTPIESFACARPVIASDILGNNELVKNGDNGFLVPKRNAEKIVEAIIALYNNQKMLQQMSNNALKTYTNVFSFERFCLKYIDLYEEVLN